MRYVFHTEAEAEFDAAIDYYEDREPGLGYDFAVEVHSTLENILSFPKAWPIFEEDIRRVRLDVFLMALSMLSTKMLSSSLPLCTCTETPNTGKID